MSGTAVFTSPLTFGPTGPGQASTGNSQCSALSAPVNVTAGILDDVNSVFSVAAVTSFQLETIIKTPDPGEVKGPPKPVKIETAVQVGQSNGVTKLPVASGQYVTVTVRFKPTATSPNNCTGTLQINGDTWDPISVSVPLSGSVGAVTVDVPAITVVQNQTSSVDITVSLTAGAPTIANLSLQPGNFSPTQIGNFPLPSVEYNISPTGMLTLSAPASRTISKGSAAKWKLAVNAGGLNPGVYSFSIGGSAYDGGLPLDEPLVITVEAPYFVIQSALGTVVDIVGASTKAGAGLDAYTQKKSDNENQLWTFVADPAGSGYYYIVSKLTGNVIDIEGAATKAGTRLDAHPRKVADDGFSASKNQLWYFVLDPSGTGDCFIASALDGNVIDIQGASATPGALLDADAVKLTGFTNQLWKVVGGVFPSMVQTVPAPSVLGNGNVNWNLGGQGAAVTGLSATVDFISDFVSTANGYSFQLNCYSTEPSSTEWQQFVIWCDPGDTQLYARIDTWASPSKSSELNRIDSPLYNLPSTTIPSGYSFIISIDYYQDPQQQYTDQYTAIVAGATWTVRNNKQETVGTTSISIVGQTLRTTSNPATMANLAPIAAFEFCIGGNYGSSRATLTSAAGNITYNSTAGLAVSTTEPTYTAFNDPGTGENANLLFGPMPWPWSLNMTNLNNRVMQLFELPRGAPKELLLKAKPGAHALPPPDALSLGAHAVLYRGKIAATKS